MLIAPHCVCVQLICFFNVTHRSEALDTVGVCLVLMGVLMYPMFCCNVLGTKRFRRLPIEEVVGSMPLQRFGDEGEDEGEDEEGDSQKPLLSDERGGIHDDSDDDVIDEDDIDEEVMQS
jgi:hypothetical protein